MDQHNTLNAGAHGATRPLASNGIGTVSLCPCGVLTLNLNCFSLRLEPAAFQALHRLLGLALGELGVSDAATAERTHSSQETTPATSAAIVGGAGEALH